VLADRETFGCVLWNLLDNAVKYSPDSRTVWVGLDCKDGFVNIHVRDRGVGIPREEQERIFHKFVRGGAAAGLAVQGAGIGLAVARQVIDAHGGKIQVESAPGAGSTFTIILPVMKS
jgi:signal transduction histidine kinase